MRAAINTRINELKLRLFDYINGLTVDYAADQLGRKFMHDAMPPVLTLSEKKRTSRYDGEKLFHGKVINRYVFLVFFQLKMNAFLLELKLVSTPK